MSDTIGVFLDDLRSRIDYFRAEFDLTYAAAIGCLEIVKQELVTETMEDDDD